VSEDRLAAWIADLSHALESGLRGAIVECGVYRGGCVFAASFVAGRVSRNIHVTAYDTFTGMTDPGPEDADHSGLPAATALAANPDWKCACSWRDFWENAHAAGCPNNIGTIRGDILRTIPRYLPASISALRLDLDWHDLTAHALAHLFPLLSPGAPLHIDDYGHWQGARKATDAFLATHPNLRAEPIDYTGVRILTV
jgi:hypothetical protein